MKKVLFVLTLLMILFWSNTSAHASEQHKEEDLCVARTENITVTRVFLNNDGKRVNTETYTITDPIEVSEFLSSVKWEEEYIDAEENRVVETRTSYTESYEHNIMICVDSNDVEVAMFDQKVTVWRYTNNRVRIDDRVFLKAIYDPGFSLSHFSAGSIVNTDGYMSYISGDTLHTENNIFVEDGILINIDAFIGFSERNYNNLINLIP